MAFDDLRSFLQALDDHGQLLKISEEVNAEPDLAAAANRSEEHTSELQSHSFIAYAVFCLKNKN